MQLEDLSKKSYWDERFLTEESFEWLGKCSRLYPEFDAIFDCCSPPAAILLHLGCGSSSLAEEMFSRCYCQSIVNVDNSFSILNKRRRTHRRNLNRDQSMFEERCRKISVDLVSTVLLSTSVSREESIWLVDRCSFRLRSTRIDGVFRRRDDQRSIDVRRRSIVRTTNLEEMVLDQSINTTHLQEETEHFLSLIDL